MDARLDSAVGGRPNFVTTHWGLVVAASSQGTTEVRAALEEIDRLCCYPVYSLIRRRDHGQQDGQDFTQDFFVHLLEKGAFGRADPNRGRFRSFLLGALDYCLAQAAKRAGAGERRGGGWQVVFLEDDRAEDRYQLAAPEGMTAQEICDARWASAPPPVEAAFARLRAELESEGKSSLFESLPGFLLGQDDSSNQQVAHKLNLSPGAPKTLIHRLSGHNRELPREELARTVTKPAAVEEELGYLRTALKG